MCGLDVGSFKPNKLARGERLRWSSGAFTFHDFCGHIQGCSDVGADLFEGFQSFFNRRELGREVDGGKEFGLKPIPDLERRSSSSCVCSDVMGKFSEGELVGPIVLLVV